MKPFLEKLAANLMELKDDVIVAGHTDNVPMRGGRYASNLELSAARAGAVADFFIHQCGFDPQRVATMGFGEYRPLADNDTPEGRQKNRRVEIVLTDFKIPGAEKEKKAGAEKEEPAAAEEKEEAPKPAAPALEPFLAPGAGEGTTGGALKFSAPKPKRGPM